MTELRDIILGTVEDLVSDFLYYDRKEDEELPRGAINDALMGGVISIEEIVAKFDACLREGVKPD